MAHVYHSGAQSHASKKLSTRWLLGLCFLAFAISAAVIIVPSQEPTKPLQNLTMKDHSFLPSMYSDPYFPNDCVDKVKEVLIALCRRIEANNDLDLEGLYRLTHASTEDINDLETCFAEQDSEIETAAREAIADAFATIANAYEFEADVEELIATRTW